MFQPASNWESVSRVGSVTRWRSLRSWAEACSESVRWKGGIDGGENVGFGEICLVNPDISVA